MAVILEIVRQLVERAPSPAADRLEIPDSVHSVADLPLDWRVEFEERAAILEYDGGLMRDAADRQALNEIVERMKRLKQSQEDT